MACRPNPPHHECPAGAHRLKPFVPSGPDFDLARRFFRGLGFEERWFSDGNAGFRAGAAEFILQRFDDAHFAGNLMLRLDVPDLDVWWNEVSARGLEHAFPGVRLKPPTDHPWGREVHLLDLPGACWQVGGTPD